MSQQREQDVSKDFGWPAIPPRPARPALPPPNAAPPRQPASAPTPAETTMADRSPSSMIDAIQKLGADIRGAQAVYDQLLAQFVDLHGESFEYPVVEDGKKKWARVYRPKGQYVYNREYEFSTRVKPENPAPGTA